VRALIRETFRWRSPVPFGWSSIREKAKQQFANFLTGVPHMLTEDDVYEGYHIEKGSVVFALEWYVAPQLLCSFLTYTVPCHETKPCTPTQRTTDQNAGSIQLSLHTKNH